MADRATIQFKADQSRKVALHSRVFYCQDQVTLAVYHARPKEEVDLLLAELKEAITTSKES